MVCQTLRASGLCGILETFNFVRCQLVSEVEDDPRLALSGLVFGVGVAHGDLRDETNKPASRNKSNNKIA